MMLYHVVLPALAGLVAHHGFFIHGEWHLRTAEIIGTRLALAALAFNALFFHGTEKANINVHGLDAIAVQQMYAGPTKGILLFPLFFLRLLTPNVPST
ncbi:cytochrome P450 [Apiospora sp. TS-2023a]